MPTRRSILCCYSACAVVAMLSMGAVHGAWAEAKRGKLDGVPPDQYQPNARRRCEVHSADDRAACEARMRGAGRVSGSVTGGGLYREIEVITPAPTPSPNPDRKEKK